MVKGKGRWGWIAVVMMKVRGMVGGWRM